MSAYMSASVINPKIHESVLKANEATSRLQPLAAFGLKPDSAGERVPVELKALCLPVTITIPDIPDTTPGCTPGCDEFADDPSGSLTVPPPTEARCIASDSTSHRLSIATQRREDAQGLGTTTGSPDISISIDDRLGLLSGLGISVCIKSIRRTQLKFRWFQMQGTIAPLCNPSDIPGLDRVDFRPFDVFIHTYFPAPGDSETQIWVWEPLQSSGLSPPCSWKSVAVGYMCPGPGFLQGRHLMTSDKGEPVWVTGSTRYRRYK
ncbi:hypothetical protein EDB89DRAFT_2205356 [Lactarius sanguifluus]|nr:hypothetical protein EDB89DRAFT_2205356 [Lactarius sanguifluus]